MARYFQNTHYDPISQAYNPTTLKYMDEAGASLQKSSDDQLAGLSELQKTLNIVGGRKSTSLAKEFVNQYEPEIQKIYDDIAANGNTKGGLAKIAQIKNKITSSPIYNYIKEDEAYVPYADKLGLNPETRDQSQSINDLYNPNGSWKQVTMDQAKNGFDANIYGEVRNKNFQEDHQDIYAKIKEQSTKIGGPVSGLTYKEIPDGMGGMVLAGFDVSNQVVRTGISREDVAALANNITKDKTNWNTHESVRFRDLQSKKNNGVGYDQSDYINDLVNNFPGYYGKDSDLTTEKQVSAKSKMSSSSGSGNTNSPYNMDNIYGDILDNIYTDKVKKGENGKPVLTTGTTSVNEKQMSALVGGEIKNGDMITSLTGRRVYLTTPEQVVKEGKSIIDNRKAVEFQAELNLMQNNIINRLNNPESPELATGYIDPKNGLSYSRVGLGKNSYISEKDLSIPGGKGLRKLTEKQFAETQNEYKSIKLKAIAQGIDLDDPKTIEAIKDSTKEDEVITTFNQALAEGALNGEFKLIPAKDGDNVITDKEGNMYGRNYVEMSKDQISNISPDNFWTTGGGYETLLEKGIIKKSWTKNVDGSSTLMYQVPVTIQSDDNTDNITRNSQLSIYKDDDKTQASINTLQQVNANKQNYYKGLTQSKNIESALNNKKYSSSDLVKDLSEVEDSSGLIKTVLDRINDLKDDKSKNKELSDLWLMTNNHPAWIEKHKEDEDTADVGKSQGDWVQTPANPLKKQLTQVE